jgi:predicted DNA-binding transcriptional regulator AlpA
MMTPRIILGDRPPSYVSKPTLAAELDVSESTVDEYVKRGILPKPLHMGKLVRWNWAQVQASLEPLNRSQVTDPFIAGLKNVSKTAAA